ncbi:hypothetical protein DRJ04_02700 [Candidatus Aerophobetes bacterium]|uniref:Uncharacterized protein n=1 Tax=Aerophobetes bacterium TaxID=2030807 RepID=A0A662DHE2_UNCAE|nr:MAG: hypothetical protein DRJ04_02700 [Candidatus Aerophobetes bacterium]
MSLFAGCILSTRKCSRTLFSRSAIGFWERFPHPTMVAKKDKKVDAYLQKCSSNRVSYCKSKKKLKQLVEDDEYKSRTLPVADFVIEARIISTGGKK